MKLHLVASHIYGKNVISPNCERSYLLYELIGRPSLTPLEIGKLGKIGFEIEIGGKTKVLSKEMRVSNYEHDNKEGKITNIIDRNRADF